jgi:hypothetical protein
MIKKAEPKALRHDFLNISMTPSEVTPHIRRRKSGRIFSMEEEK